MNKHTLIGFTLITLGVIITVSGSLIGIALMVFGLLLQLKGRGKIERIFYQLPPNLNLESKVLRACIASYWVILVLAILASPFEESALPREIIRFSDAQTEAIPAWLLIMTLGFMLLNFIGSIGVYFLQPWGKNTYVSGLVGTVLLTPFFGAVVVTPIFGILNVFLDGLSGAVLCLLFLSPAKEHFVAAGAASD